MKKSYVCFAIFLARYRKYLVVLSIAMLPLLLPSLYLYYLRTALTVTLI